jgi:agmatine/peptidylarginine deiminase
MGNYVCPDGHDTIIPFNKESDLLYKQMLQERQREDKHKQRMNDLQKHPVAEKIKWLRVNDGLNVSMRYLSEGRIYMANAWGGSAVPMNVDNRILKMVRDENVEKQILALAEKLEQSRERNLTP